MREVRQTLGDIAFQHEVALDQVVTSVADADLKTSVTAKIRAAHRAKRQGYLDLLHGLRRQQHRQSCAACTTARQPDHALVGPVLSIQ